MELHLVVHHTVQRVFEILPAWIRCGGMIARLFFSHPFAKAVEKEPIAAPTITFIRSLNIAMVLSMSGVAAWANVEMLAENT